MNIERKNSFFSVLSLFNPPYNSVRDLYSATVVGSSLFDSILVFVLFVFCFCLLNVGERTLVPAFVFCCPYRCR